MVTKALRDHFSTLFRSGDPKDITLLRKTGNNGWELYATKKSDAWLSMAYSNDHDDWKDGAFRVDPYWFIHNSASFRDLYRPIWKLLKDMEIPYRLHWGKSFPTRDDTDITPEHLMKTYNKLPDFLKLREEKDPKNVFLNSYWSHWLGISS